MKLNKLLFSTIVATLFLFAVSCKHEQKQQSKLEDVETVRISEELTTEFLITPTGINELTNGDSIQEHANVLVRDSLQTGEGTFEVFKYSKEQGTDIAYIYLDEDNNIELIEVISDLYKTEQGVGVGSSFDEVKLAYPNSKTHGSEIEGRTTVQTEGIQFLIDAYYFNYEVNESEIDPETIVKRVQIISTEK